MGRETVAGGTGTKLRRWESTTRAERTRGRQKAIAAGDKGSGVRGSRQVLTGGWDYTGEAFLFLLRGGRAFMAASTEYLRGKVTNTK